MDLTRQYCRDTVRSMAKSKLSDATSSVYDILEPFEEGERTKIVGAAMVLLGQSPPAAGGAAGASNGTVAPPPDPSDSGNSEFGLKARRWMQQNAISSEMLEECFHLEPDPPEVVADIPGKSAREKTANCYVLTGIAAFLKTDEPNFADGTARSLCEHTGCYDATNHTKYVKLGNRASGDKKNGWKLLAPGLKAGATLVKELAGASNE